MSNQESDMSFLSHLEVLRWHLVRSIIVILFCSLFCFLIPDIIFQQILLGPTSSDFITYQFLSNISNFLGFGDLNFSQISNLSENMIALGVLDQLFTHVKVSFYAGFILSFPYVIWEIFRFVKPALNQNENRMATSLMIFSSLLFFLGLLFGYYIVVPLSINFASAYSVSNQIVLNAEFISFIALETTICFANGFLFELPMIIYILSKFGLVTPDFLNKYKRHAIILILIFSAIITPPDIVSQILVAFPVLILYNISIIISRKVINNRE